MTKEKDSGPKDPTTNKQWGEDIIKARLTQTLRGEDMAHNEKTWKIIQNVLSAILGALAGYFGGK